MEEEDGQSGGWNSRQGSVPRIKWGTFIVMATKPLKSGKESDKFIKFVSLKDLSGLLWRIDDKDR